MPKVSEEHLARRRRQILDAALDCFAGQGFHVTSMQDIFRASGLSAGAVYRYFPTKTSLIREIAADTLTDAASLLDNVGTSAGVPSVPDVVTSIVRKLGTGRPSRVPIIVQIWAEAMRDGELAELARSLLGHLLDRLRHLLDLHVKAGRLPPDADTAALAHLVLATIQGYIIQLGIFGEVPEDQVEAAVRAVFG
jgi:AcrR family transcriptional regulator